MTGRSIQGIPLAENHNLLMADNAFAKASRYLNTNPDITHAELAWSAIELALHAETPDKKAAQCFEVAASLTRKYTAFKGDGSQHVATTAYSALPLFEGRRFGFTQERVDKARERLAAVGNALLSHPSNLTLQGEGPIATIGFFLAGMRGLNHTAADDGLYYPVGRREKGRYHTYRVVQTPQGKRRADSTRLRGYTMRSTEGGNLISPADFSLLNTAAVGIKEAGLNDHPARALRWLVAEASGRAISSTKFDIIESISHAIVQRAHANRHFE